MIIIMKATATTTDITDLKDRLESRGLRAVVMQGQEKTAVGVIGETRLHLPADQILALPSVESIRRVSDPCKLANRLFHPEDTIVKAGSAKVGGGHFAMIAGPCSIESEEQIVGIAKAVKAALPLFEDVDVIQVGARSMQNFEMLKELGRTNKPILLKRGLANTIKELLMAAEYIMASGNDQIILCERGIRTYETATRNTLDLSAVPVLHEKTHLPVVIDPSHATGVARYVPSMAAAAAACGADGLMIEVHNNPAAALCDGPQSITPEEFERVVKTVNAVRAAVNLHNMAAPSAVRTAEDVIRVCAS